MRAQCNVCGADIPCPDGTLPLGECPVCSPRATPPVPSTAELANTVRDGIMPPGSFTQAHAISALAVLEERATQAEAENLGLRERGNEYVVGFHRETDRRIEAEDRARAAEARADRLEAALRKIETGYTRIARAGLPHGGSL